MATTTIEENRAVARDHFERVWNGGVFDDAVLADGYHVVANIGERAELTPKQFRGKVNHFREAFPDLHKEPTEVIPTEGEVIIPYTFTGTHENELMGIPATGNEVEVGAVDIVYLDDGRVTREWYVADFLRMMRQLGIAD